MLADSPSHCALPGCALLDSALEIDQLGAQTLLATDPFAILTGWPDRLEIAWQREGRRETLRGDATAALRAFLAGQARTAAGGLIGYFAYEWNSPCAGCDAPAFEFCAYEEIHTLPAVAPALSAAPGLAWDGPRAAAGLQASFSPETYFRAVRRIRDYIAAGDVYQVNLTERFEAPLAGHPFALYQRLRRRTPAPFAAYIDTGATQIVSASPERLLRIRDRHAETRPIKGTRPRGRSPAEDQALAHELLHSAKDRAELLMIADLARNDLGRVSEFGSVHVDSLWRLESHPTVHHLSAQVSATLRREVDALDCLAALFPGGSITGAPKIRAMEIIREIEPCPRHAYTGAIGYLRFNGDCDFNIAIRSLFCRDGRVRFHAGGGIVWDSEPEAELAELNAKARALHAAVTEP